MAQTWIAGVDEAGRGPLAGPVVAAAVILNPEMPIDGLRDSKKLSEKKRNALFDEIKERALAWGIGEASVEEIDHLNILQATFLAMRRAVAGLPTRPSEVLIDGRDAPEVGVPARGIIGGDDSIECISAASILAKVTRDRALIQLDELYPDYGFAKHKGYGTKLHMEQLKALGATPHHRRSFAPVRAVVRGV